MDMAFACLERVTGSMPTPYNTLWNWNWAFRAWNTGIDFSIIYWLTIIYWLKKHRNALYKRGRGHSHVSCSESPQSWRCLEICGFRSFRINGPVALGVVYSNIKLQITLTSTSPPKVWWIWCLGSIRAILPTYGSFFSRIKRPSCLLSFFSEVK